MRDRRADSRFDIIRLRFRSSTTEPKRLVPSEPGVKFLELLRLGSSEPELKFLDLFRFGSGEPDFGVAGAGFEVYEPELELTGSWEG